MAKLLDGAGLDRQTIGSTRYFDRLVMFGLGIPKEGAEDGGIGISRTFDKRT